MINPLIGTCSWNYDSWVGLVYTRKCPTAADYLKEYSLKYRTAEIDSWFYKIPLRQEAESYRARVDDDFRFTCKVSNQISLTHRRNFKNPGPLQVNPDFLSPGLFQEYLRAAEPLNNQIDAYMLEFEYLNREKMPSQDTFLRALDDFLKDLEPIARMALDLVERGFKVTINVNNHYEGSSPLTIEKLLPLF